MFHVRPKESHTFCCFLLCRCVHSPIGLPIPNRNGGLLGFPSIKQESTAEDSNSPAGGMWGCPPTSGGLRGLNSIPFPVTPFNTPAQGPASVFTGPDFKGFFLSDPNHLNSNPTLSVSIKEEQPDLETDMETMKVKR